MNRIFKYTNVEQIGLNNFKESKSYKFKYYFNDITDYVLYKSFYKIEYLYLVNKLKTNNFKIYDIDYLEDNSKIVYLRLKDTNALKKVKIPKLKEIYDYEDIYTTKRVYIWKTKKGIRKVYTLDKLVNRLEHRYYRVGDINKYGHELVRITSEDVFVHRRKYCSAVSLKIS